MPCSPCPCRCCPTARWQLRFSEALTVLPFLFPGAIPGLFLGCAIANIASTFGILDVVFGSLATLLAAVWTSN